MLAQTQPNFASIELACIQNSGTLLDYAFYYAALEVGAPAATLQLLVTNRGQAAITCAQIVVTLPIGPNGSDLTLDPTRLQTQTPPGWRLTRNGGRVTFIPDPASQTIAEGQDSLAFYLYNFPVNSEPGHCAVAIHEQASTATAANAQREGHILLAKNTPARRLLAATPTLANPPAGMKYSNTLLNYTIQYVPFEAGDTNVALTLLATNSRTYSVACQKIVVTLPIGTYAANLTENSENIQVKGPPEWNITRRGGAFTFTPNNSQTAIEVGKASLQFFFANIAVNNEAGTATLLIDEESSPGNKPNEPRIRKAKIDLTKQTPHFAINEFWAEPSVVPLGGKTTLWWEGKFKDGTPDGRYFTAHLTLSVKPAGQPEQTYDVNKLKDKLNAFELDPLTTSGRIDFTLKAKVKEVATSSARTQKAKTSVDVEPPPPAIKQFSGKLCPEADGLYLELKWATQYADHCEISELPGYQKLQDTIKIPKDQAKSSYTLFAGQGFASNPSKSVSSTIKAELGSVSKTVDIANGAKYLAVSPHNNHIYVAHSGNRVSKLERGTLQRIGKDVELIDNISGLAIDQGHVYALNIKIGDLIARGHVAIIEPLSMRTLEDIPVNIASTAVIASPDGVHFYIIEKGNNRVFMIPTDPRARNTRDIGVGHTPIAAVVAPNSARAYVANYDDNTVSVIDTAGCHVIGNPITVGRKPIALAVSADGRRAYVANRDDKTVSVIDTKTSQVIDTPIKVAGQPDVIAVSPTGHYLCVTGAFQGVQVIDLTANPPAPLTTLLLSPKANNQHLNIAIAPEGNCVYVANPNDNNLSILNLPAVSGGING